MPAKKTAKKPAAKKAPAKKVEEKKESVATPVDKWRYVIRRGDGTFWTGKDWDAQATKAQRFKKCPATIHGGIYKLKGDVTDYKTLFYQHVQTHEKMQVLRSRVTKKDK
jgi:hypothetical protein